MPKTARIVIGLGYGDEGKGLATDYLCRESTSPLVVRFNGGHQAGHTVVTADGHQHIFSTFGAGTLRGVPTYWSNYCTFSPAVLLPEYRDLPVKPKLLVDRYCPVTTHYDILYNRVLEMSRGDARHGSCGLGFGATVERHQLQALRLYPADLLSADSYQAKLQLIRSYYRAKITQNTPYSFSQFDHDTADAQFNKEAEAIAELHHQGIIELVNESDVFAPTAPWQTFIFEGAQGVLLDMDFGTYPHVTRSNTTSKNALQLLGKHMPTLATEAEILYVTRCYQTRHGAGPFADNVSKLTLHNTDQEANRYNDHQGEFKSGCLNIDSLNYALACDAHFSEGLSKRLLVTCLDQLDEANVPYQQGGETNTTHYMSLPRLLDVEFKECLFSFTSCADYLGANGSS